MTTQSGRPPHAPRPSRRVAACFEASVGKVRRATLAYLPFGAFVLRVCAAAHGVVHAWLLRRPLGPASRDARTRPGSRCAHHVPRLRQRCSAGPGRSRQLTGAGHGPSAGLGGAVGDPAGAERCEPAPHARVPQMAPDGRPTLAGALRVDFDSDPRGYCKVRRVHERACGLGRLGRGRACGSGGAWRRRCLLRLAAGSAQVVRSQSPPSYGERFAFSTLARATSPPLRWLSGALLTRRGGAGWRGASWRFTLWHQATSSIAFPCAWPTAQSEPPAWGVGPLSKAIADRFYPPQPCASRPVSVWRGD